MEREGQAGAEQQMLRGEWQAEPAVMVLDLDGENKSSSTYAATAGATDNMPPIPQFHPHRPECF